MGNKLEGLTLQIEQLITDMQELAQDINRGPGGRETALTITKLQEAEDWFNRAKREVVPDAK